MDLHLRGRSAVVTGASKGIGLAITRALADEGVSVVAGALRGSDELDELTASADVRSVRVDLTTSDGPGDSSLRRRPSWAVSTSWSTTSAPFVRVWRASSP